MIDFFSKRKPKTKLSRPQDTMTDFFGSSKEDPIDHEDTIENPGKKIAKVALALRLKNMTYHPFMSNPKSVEFKQAAKEIQEMVNTPKFI